MARSKNRTDPAEITVARKRAKQKGVLAPFPGEVRPMLATLVKEPFTHSDWLYEVKWDGFRIITHLKDGKPTLKSRNGQNYTNNYPPLTDALRKLKHNAVLDGEIVAIDEHGKPNFDELQRWSGKLHLIYYLFDVIWLDGRDLTGLPLVERKEILKNILPAGDEVIRYSESFDDGLALFDLMKEKQWEGIIAKRKDSAYAQGVNNKRTMLWQKISTAMQQEFVVGGWAESNSGRPFKTLVFGYYDKEDLIYFGHAGGGFREKDMPAILKRLQKLEIKKSPFINGDEARNDTSTKLHWVKPQIVIQVRYATTTRIGKIRKPAIFLGFREDKDAKDVKLETPVIAPVPSTFPEDTSLRSGGNKPTARTTSKNSNWRVIESQKITDSDTFNIEGHELLLSNVARYVWKGITKAELIRYYHYVSDYILPHLKGRPLSLHIKQVSATAPGFYIKDMEGRQPHWAEIFSTPRKHKKEGTRDIIDYLVCNELSTLLWLVNLGCIDVNPWTSTTRSPEQPDFIIIDLDPSDEDFSKAVETAIAARQYFKKKKLIAFPKTSGKTGIHIYIPCRGLSFPQARSIAEAICSEIHALVPSITTINVSRNSRGKKLYIDPNQNDFADTVAAPYSARPHHLPTVSTPLEWKEVKAGLNPESFTIHTILKRLQKKGDLFMGVMDEATGTINTKILLKYL